MNFNDLARVSAQLFTAAKARLANTQPLDFVGLIKAHRSIKAACAEAIKYRVLHTKNRVKPGDEKNLVRAMKRVQTSLQEALRSPGVGTPIPGTEGYGQKVQRLCNQVKPFYEDSIDDIEHALLCLSDLVDYSLLAAAFVQGNVSWIAATSQGDTLWREAIPERIWIWIQENARQPGWSRKALPRG